MINDSNGQLRTVTNNQPVSFHPSSINFGKKVADFGVNYLCYFTIMLVNFVGGYYTFTFKLTQCRQSKKLYAWETSPVNNMALLLLCGDCEVKV